ncbi:hypothetical protein ACQPWW_33545 [Micromonospora sp. CA-240977]|uniref:hypothetical protein n=1 Tax=Micromonospora sp. CA-240977 TaxID=3239957 RepID=UPI003D915447
MVQRIHSVAYWMAVGFVIAAALVSAVLVNAGAPKQVPVPVEGGPSGTPVPVH